MNCETILIIQGYSRICVALSHDRMTVRTSSKLSKLTAYQLQNHGVSIIIMKCNYDYYIYSLFCILMMNNSLEPLRHWSQTQFMEGHSSAQFSSNPNQTHLIQLIKVFRITRNFQAAVIWSWLKLNSAELWPSRNWVWDLCSKGTWWWKKMGGGRKWCFRIEEKQDPGAVT